MITEQQKRDFAELRTIFLNYELGLRSHRPQIVANALERYIAGFVIPPIFGITL